MSRLFTVGMYVPTNKKMKLKEKKDQVEKAINTGKMLLIDYVGKDLKVTRDRLIDPYEVKTREGKNGEAFLSLIAHCYLRNDLREFQFDGIQKIKLVSRESYGKE